MNRLLIPALGAALALGACQGREAAHGPQLSAQAPRYASLDATLDAGAASPQRRASAVSILPAWIGKPLRVRENDDAETFEQVVSLGLAQKGAARENLVMVAMPRSDAARRRLLDGSAAVMGKPTEAGIHAELDAVFPGLAMQVVTRPASNAYGPYGLAIGRGAHGLRCLYAWQWIEEAPALDPARSTAGPLSLRVRLCRDDITLEAMAAAVSQIKLVPRFEGPSVASQTAQSTARPHHATHHETDGDKAARRRFGRARARPADPAEARPPAQAAVVQAAPAARAPDLSGRRYLGADPVGAAAPSRTADPMRGALAGLGGASATSAGEIVADLPPEAYRGPASGQTGGRP